MVISRSRTGATVVTAALATTAALALVSCTGDDGDATPPEPTRPLPVSADDELAPAHPVDDSPFCRTMLALDDPGDGSGDGPDAGAGPSLDEVVAAYVDVAGEVPAEIRPDFDVVLARLVAIAEGDDAAIDAIDHDAAEESLIELAEFIERRCRGTVINPLPPPTVPDDGGSSDVS